MSLHQENGRNDLGDAEQWEVFWCYDGWEMFWDGLKEKLPSWATLRFVDPNRPLAEQVQSADVLIPTTAPIGRDVIAAARRLKLVVQPATGYNNIPVDDCTARGIPVCTSPGVNATSTAEGALTTILMLARRVNEQQEVFRQRGIGLPLGIQLQGKTLGIVGMGTIGQKLATYVQALGMKIISTTSKSNRQDLEHLLQEAHVISLHCPLSPTTIGLIGHKELKMMRPGVLLVNYSRGEVIDEKALTEAVYSGKLGGVGLDVHWTEPADPQKKLYQHPCVVAFPHTGISTHEVVDTYIDLLVENIIRRREGRDLINQLRTVKDSILTSNGGEIPVTLD